MFFLIHLGSLLAWPPPTSCLGDGGLATSGGEGWTSEGRGWEAGPQQVRPSEDPSPSLLLGLGR